MLLLDSIDRAPLRSLLESYELVLRPVAPGLPIPGSYWGECEAGLIGNRVYARLDTPIHSVLHESAHYLCMTPARRAVVHTDAGGDHAEENAACYLQILLAGVLPAVGCERMCADMDDWGYSFRLGSAAAWFGSDALETRDWLMQRGLIDSDERLRACR